MYYGNQQFLFIYEQFDDVVWWPHRLIDRQVRRRYRQLDLARHGATSPYSRIYASKGEQSRQPTRPTTTARKKFFFTIDPGASRRGDFVSTDSRATQGSHILSLGCRALSPAGPAKMRHPRRPTPDHRRGPASGPAGIHHAAKHDDRQRWKAAAGRGGITRRGTVASRPARRSTAGRKDRPNTDAW